MSFSIIKSGLWSVYVGEMLYAYCSKFVQQACPILEKSMVIVNTPLRKSDRVQVADAEKAAWGPFINRQSPIFSLVTKKLF